MLATLGPAASAGATISPATSTTSPRIAARIACFVFIEAPLVSCRMVKGVRRATRRPPRAEADDLEDSLERNRRPAVEVRGRLDRRRLEEAERDLVGRDENGADVAGRNGSRGDRPGHAPRTGSGLRQLLLGHAGPEALGHEGRHRVLSIGTAPTVGAPLSRRSGCFPR